MRWFLTGDGERYLDTGLFLLTAALSGDGETECLSFGSVCFLVGHSNDEDSAVLKHAACLNLLFSSIAERDVSKRSARLDTFRFSNAADSALSKQAACLDTFRWSFSNDSDADSDVSKQAACLDTFFRSSFSNDSDSDVSKHAECINAFCSCFPDSGFLGEGRSCRCFRVGCLDVSPISVSSSSENLSVITSELRFCILPSLSVRLLREGEGEGDVWARREDLVVVLPPEECCLLLPDDGLSSTGVLAFFSDGTCLGAFALSADLSLL